MATASSCRILQLNAADSANTERVIKSSLVTLKTYLKGKSMQMSELETQPTEKFSNFLGKFYAEVKKADEQRYAKKSMICLRYGLQKHFHKVRKEDIINDERFASANKMFKAVLVQLKKDGIGERRAKDPIPPEDISKLYDTIFSKENPQALQKKTVFEYIYYFCNSGRQNLRELQKRDFSVCTDSTGRQYVTVKEKGFKKYTGDDVQSTANKQSRMYDRPGMY
jgi:hypothetical protein